MADEVNIETEARQMGWFPKEEFRGDPDKWTDAKTYVERGRQVIPILNANNRRLTEEVTALRAKTAEQDGVIKNALESIEELKEFNSKAVRDKAKDRKAELKAALVEAKKSGDHATEVELTDQLTELNSAIKTSETAPVKEPVKTEPVRSAETVDPAFTQWMADNPWYNTDMRKAGLANGIAQELRRNDPNMTLKGKAFFDKVSEEVEKYLGGNPSRGAPSKVEGGSRSNGATTTGKTYADLPPEAKAACDRQGKRLIGPKGSGRAFETEQSWREHYVTQYDWEG